MSNTACLFAALSILLGVPAIGKGKTLPGAEKWKHETVSVNGIKLHYVTQGKGQVILFLHGFPEFWYEWKDQIAEFAKTHQAVAPDLRGYNLSEKPSKVEEYAIPLLIGDIKGLVEKVSPGKKVILVAHDWGGALAWIFAAQNPDLLEKLIIINAPHPTVFGRLLQSDQDQQKASGYMNFFKSPDAEKLLSANNYAGLAGAVFSGSSRPESFTPEDRKEYIAAWSQPGAITGGLNYYRASNLGPPAAGVDKAKTPASLPDLPVITVPTLVIWGEKDTALLTGNLIGLDKYVTHLTIKRIPNGSHWVVHEFPDEINTAIHEFIK